MNVEKVAFVQGPDGAVPASVTVTMTIEEAAWIADKAGSSRGKVQSVTSPIYRALVDDVFNRYWEDGIDAARFDSVRLTP